MNESICLSWFEDIFLKQCGEERPQLLICDSHNSHEALNLLETARVNDIHILALPPHTTHKLQPLDKSVFGPLSSYFNEACTGYLSAHPLNTINKWSFPRLLTSAWERAMMPRNIKSGFASCGIYPFSQSSVRYDDMLPSSVFDKPQRVDNAESAPFPHDSVASSNTVPLPAASVEHVSELPSPMCTSLAADKEQKSDGDLLSATAVAPTSTSSYPVVTSILDNVPANTSVANQSTDSALMLSPLFTSDDPNVFVELVPSGSIELKDILPHVTDLEPTCNWNSDVDAIFGMTQNTPEIKSSGNTGKRKHLTSHRLLTSDEVLTEKRQKEEMKEIIEQKKEKRRLERETKQALNFLKQTCTPNL